MCSRNCPCPDVPSQTEWTSLSAAALEFRYGRSDLLQFKPFPGQDFTVNTYEECIEKVDENFYASSEFKAWALSWRTSAGYFDEKDFMKFFEQEYDCSGICEEPLFHFSKSVESGMPTSCFTQIKDDVRKEMFFLGATTTGTGLVLIVLWTFQYCLWRKY